MLHGVPQQASFQMSHNLQKLLIVIKFNSGTQEKLQTFTPKSPSCEAKTKLRYAPMYLYK